MTKPTGHMQRISWYRWGHGGGLEGQLICQHGKIRK